MQSDKRLVRTSFPTVRAHGSTTFLATGVLAVPGSLRKQKRAGGRASTVYPFVEVFFLLFLCECFLKGVQGETFSRKSFPLQSLILLQIFC